MKVLSPEYHDRIRHWLRTLKDDFYLPLGPIAFEAWRTDKELSYEEAMAQRYTPAAPGYTWGNQWDYCWFRGSFTLPAAAQGKRIVLGIRPGGESTLFVNGAEFGTYRAPWIEEPHHYLVDNCVTRSGEAGKTYEIVMETYAGHFYPEALDGGCCTGPVLPGAYEPPEDHDSRRTLGESTFGIWNEDAYQLYMDAMTLWKLLGTLDPASLRASRVADALEQFTLVCDFEQDLDGRTASYRAARKVLAPALAAHNGSTAPDFYAVGHAHLDLAWLWPMQEACRKTARTFAAQLRHMEEYPDYKFINSQAASYEMCRTHYPALFERIKEAVKKGQWIPEGAMWVEPDTNLSGGEALVRQILYGIRYYKETFGVDSRVLWLPDTFGYTGALPQLLKKSGIRYLVTQKIFWSYNGGERFPYHYFYWEGIDGSKVEAFLPTSYGYKTDPEEMNNTWKNRSQARDLDAFLIPFGYGDGGGGPTRDHLEYLKREQDLEGMPRMHMAAPAELFDKLHEEGGPQNTWRGELYFDAHRGTYTTQARVKRNNRRAEWALHDLDLWGTAASATGGKIFDYAEAEALWKELLLHQFHDILPGSGIARIYREAERRVEAVIASAQERADDYVKALAEPAGDVSAVSVWNSLSFARKALISLPEAFRNGAVTADGTRVPVEVCDGKVRALVEVPAAGAVSLRQAQGSDPDTENPAGVVSAAPCEAADKAIGNCPDVSYALIRNATAATAADGGFVLENGKIRAVFNDKAEITSFVRKDSGREFAAEPMNRFRLFKDVPRVFDAWDIDSNYEKQEIPALTDAKVMVRKAAGLTAELLLTGTIDHSAITQVISLRADADRVEFHTVIDWQELHRLLKVSFPVQVYTDNGINEMQFGYVERPVHRSRQYDKDRYEVCNHRYTVLCDGNHGAAVLNDCKYGISMNGNAMELTLLRAAASPEMRSDNRRQEFSYAFLGFEGSFAESDVVREGLDFNEPVRVMEGAPAAGSFSLVTIDRKNVILDTVKLAEDRSGDVILRLYEAQKSACTAKIRMMFTGKVYLCDLLENPETEIPFEDGTMTLPFGDFEVRTIRVRKK